ncbi:hypothetical protein KC726_02965 [Candidatus Woesebacteria bacterium]|nr:hypothetical protein [Candidatus Woesebacteria bacterium]
MKKNTIKYIIGLTIIVALRLIPHPPNTEPIMTTMMPFSRKWGKWSGLVFGVLAIIAYDFLTQTLGVWTLITATSYGLLGLLAGIYFSKQKGNNVWGYVTFAVVGTLLYDAFTGFTIGPLFFYQSFSEAFFGQIPFTLYHLSGNVVLSFILSPLIYQWVIANPKLETNYIMQKLALK